MNDKTIYFDCKTGISSDMVLATLLDLGINPNLISNGLSLLDFGEFEVKVKKELRYEVEGSNVFFHFKNEEKSEHSHRSYKEIENIILNSRLKESVKNRAISIYKVIAEAEAKVHETDIDKVHFHEVGRKTAIFNIVGVAIGMEILNIREVFCSDIHDGSGFINCSHGKIPVPVPAVLAMLEGTKYNLIKDDFETEMVTPSGLGILKGLEAINTEKIPSNKSISGYGFGKKDIGKLSVLRGYLLDK